MFWDNVSRKQLKRLIWSVLRHYFVDVHERDRHEVVFNAVFALWRHDTQAAQFLYGHDRLKADFETWPVNCD